MKKGGNAVEATREQPLSRASVGIIGYRSLKHKGGLLCLHFSRFAIP